MPITPKIKDPRKTLKKKKQSSGTVDQSNSTAAPGRTPEYRTTVQGDRFDYNKPIASSTFSNRESYEQAKRIKQGQGGGGFTDSGEFGRNEAYNAQVLANQQAVEQQVSQEKITQERENLSPSLTEQQFASEGGYSELQTTGEVLAERGDQVLTGAAKVGLTASANAANTITAGLEFLSGGKIQGGRTSAAEMAETTFGKILGASITGVAAALLVATTGTAIAGYIGKGTAALSSSLGISPGFLATGAAVFTGFKTDVVVDKILGRKSASEIISGITTVGQRTPTIVGTYQSGGYGNNPSLALAHITKIEDDFNILEHEIQQASILDPRVKQSGEYLNILQDIEDQREIIQESRTTILNTVPQYDPNQIALILSEINAESGKKRGKLVDQGFISNAI